MVVRTEVPFKIRDPFSAHFARRVRTVLPLIPRFEYAITCSKTAYSLSTEQRARRGAGAGKSIKRTF